MEFVNLTPYPAMAFDGLDQRDSRFHTVVMRLTFELQADGSLALAPEQTPLVTTDEYYGEINQSSVKQESDFAPYKPHTDILITANAHAPQQRPTARFTVGLHVASAPEDVPAPDMPPQPQGLSPFQAPSYAAMQAWRDECAKLQNTVRPAETILDKQLVVTGPRQWRKRYLVTRAASLFTLPAWKLTGPQPAMQVPMRFENAYGGENKILATDKAAKRVKTKNRIAGITPLTEQQANTSSDTSTSSPAIAHTAYVQNTVGSGYAEGWYLKASGTRRIAAAQIEAPGERITQFGKAYTPRGFGVVTRAWQPRLPQAGTYDQAWLDNRHPYLPADFNFAYWNAAPMDQQVVPHLAGNETITLTNLCPASLPGKQPAIGQDSAGNTQLKLMLPGHLPFVLVRFDEGQVGELAAKLDTVTIDTTPDLTKPDKKISVVCVWRATVATEPGVRVLEARMIAAKDLPEMRQLAQQQAQALATAAQAAQAAARRAATPLPNAHLS